MNTEQPHGQGFMPGGAGDPFADTRREPEPETAGRTEQPADEAERDLKPGRGGFGDPASE